MLIPMIHDSMLDVPQIDVWHIRNEPGFVPHHGLPLMVTYDVTPTWHPSLPASCYGCWEMAESLPYVFIRKVPDAVLANNVRALWRYLPHRQAGFVRSMALDIAEWNLVYHAVSGTIGLANSAAAQVSVVRRDRMPRERRP